jgi:hypothetical protein
MAGQRSPVDKTCGLVPIWAVKPSELVGPGELVQVRLVSHALFSLCAIVFPVCRTVYELIAPPIFANPRSAT